MDDLPIWKINNFTAFQQKMFPFQAISIFGYFDFQQNMKLFETFFFQKKKQIQFDFQCVIIFFVHCQRYVQCNGQTETNK